MQTFLFVIVSHYHAACVQAALLLKFTLIISESFMPNVCIVVLKTHL